MKAHFIPMILATTLLFSGLAQAAPCTPHDRKNPPQVIGSCEAATQKVIIQLEIFNEMVGFSFYDYQCRPVTFQNSIWAYVARDVEARLQSSPEFVRVSYKTDLDDFLFEFDRITKTGRLKNYVLGLLPSGKTTGIANVDTKLVSCDVDVNRLFGALY